MALKSGTKIFYSSVSQMNKPDSAAKHPKISVSYNNRINQGVFISGGRQPAKSKEKIGPVEGENGKQLQSRKDSNTLPRPLSNNDLSLHPTDYSKIRVAYKGIAGSFSEAAAAKVYPLCETVPCKELEAAFEAVEEFLVDRAILPIESTVGGSLHRNYDLLLRHKLHIVGEVYMPVQLCLLGLPKVRKEEITRVLSHSQAFAQCEATLSKLNVVKENVDDTALAAQLVASNNRRDTGAIASARSAEIYGLNVLADRVEDDLHNNVSRFLILGREPVIPRTGKPYKVYSFFRHPIFSVSITIHIFQKTEECLNYLLTLVILVIYQKTSIVFPLHEGPGVLFKALAVFAYRGINLTKIESRPQRQRPLRTVDDSDNGISKYFDYLFYVDFEASMSDHNAQNALGHLKEFATFIRVLGSYPEYTAL
ncbi:hypothetical protein ACHQM5_003970 [Ranunculus cassubicifolius]